jgi:hypothetical protein
MLLMAPVIVVLFGRNAFHLPLVAMDGFSFLSAKPFKTCRALEWLGKPPDMLPIILLVTSFIRLEDAY